jgi:hypothetical protein
MYDPVVTTADATTSSIDLQGYDSAEVIVNVGESGDTLSGSVKWDLKLMESDDNTVFTAVATADALVRGNAITTLTTGIFATIDATDEDDAAYRVGYVGGKRYVHVAIDATGTHSTGTPIGVTGLRGNAHQAPTT